MTYAKFPWILIHAMGACLMVLAVLLGMLTYFGVATR